MSRWNLESDREIVEKYCKPDHECGCWLWTGQLNKSGYGRLGPGRRERAAHRLAYRAFVGEIPAGRLVLHRCDNPRCVNPSHLFLGSLSDNMRDMVAKRRHSVSRGSASPLAKLSEASVRAIREARFAGENVRGLANHHGVSIHAIYLALRGKTWAHI